MVRAGLPFCNCKEGFYFDRVAAETNDREWYEQGCSECSKLLQNAKAFVECPGGPKSVDATSSRRRMQNGTQDDGRYPITGPLIATTGYFVEAQACTVCATETDDAGVCLGGHGSLTQKTCVNAFPCTAESCYGLYATVEKEMEDLATGPNGGAPCEALGWANTRTDCPVDDITDETIFAGCTGGERNCYNGTEDWCYSMHYIALQEGVPEDELLIVEEGDDSSNPQTNQRYFWQTTDGCDINYIDAIYRNRQKKGNGLQNFCHVGHEGELCATCSLIKVGETMQRMEKGDDGLCHYCQGHDWFVLIRNELAVCLGYYIPYNLFFRSGRPQALKSAMFASFTFFIQTVSLLGKDTGYFMGKDYMTQEGDKAMKKAVVEAADAMGKFFSISLQASEEPTVEVDPETGERLLKPQETCPVHLDAYQQFYKGALFKSLLILIGVTLWYQGIYHMFVFSRAQYYVCSFLKAISFGKLCKDINWEWSTEIKVLYQHKEYDNRTRREKRKAAGQNGDTERKWVPKIDRVVYGPHAVLLNFHTCGVLMQRTKEIQDSKDKAARVRATAQFKLVDTDGGGTLDHDELLELLTSMGLHHLAKNDVVGGKEVEGSGINRLFEQIARDHDFKFDIDEESGETVMSEDQFVEWWTSLKKPKARGCCAGGLRAFCCQRGDFRPIGSVRGECIVEALDSEENELARIEHHITEEQHKEKHGEEATLDKTPPVHDAPHVAKYLDKDEHTGCFPPVWFDGDTIRCTCVACGLQPWHEQSTNDRQQEFCKCNSPQGSTEVDFKKDIAVHAGIYPVLSMADIDNDILRTQLLEDGVALIKQVYAWASHGRPAGSLSFEEVQEMCKKETGGQPSKERVAEVVQMMGTDDFNDERRDDLVQWWTEHTRRHLRDKYAASNDDTILSQLLEAKKATIKISQEQAMERVVVRKLEPLGPSSLNVTFDVLPVGYNLESRREDKWGRAGARTLDSVVFRKEDLQNRPEEVQKKLEGKILNRKQVAERDTKSGLKVRSKLQAAFSSTGTPPRIAHHHCSGLGLETLINLEDLNNNSRFLRAVFMLAATVLFYPVIQATLPVITCFPYDTYKYWDPKAKCSNGISLCPAWKTHAFASTESMMENRTKVTRYLVADMSEKCEGYRYEVSRIIAFTVLGMSLVCPLYALLSIRRSKHAAEAMANAAAKKEGREPRAKRKTSFCRQLFMGTHREPSRRERIEFEKRILRDPYSALYGMCEQRAYYWFIVDLLRKAAVTCIYTFVGDMYQYVLLIFFVLFAINHDIAQPYRGRTENLFAFITLMFIIILIHTSTIVTYGSMLPMIMAVCIVFLVFIIFGFSMYYGKKAAEEEFAEEERTKRKAQDLWAEIASKVLNMDPQRSTEEEMKEAFSVFDDQRIGESDDDDSGSESDGQGEIEVGELKAFRDSDRKLVPRKPGEPPLELFGFEATDDEIDSMLYEADLDGEGKIDYDEFVSVIFSAWERKQQTDNLSKWLFRNYKRIDHGERSKAAGFTPQKKLFTKDIGMHQKFLSEHKSLAERGEELICNPTLFAGLVDSLGDLSAKMDEKNPRWKGLARSFHVDMKINRIIGACQRSIYIIHMYSLNFRSRLLAARAYLETNQACLLPHQASKRLEGILTTSKRAWTA
eukprot:COSAG02_NODE_2522_length_8608_cov_47.463862_1_plen_1635_part_00